jgi:hypothetical protein
MIQEVPMTLKEEVELLERKVKALSDLKELEQPKLTTTPFYWYEPKVPTRMKDVDPVIRDLMLNPECVMIS